MLRDFSDVIVMTSR